MARRRTAAPGGMRPAAWVALRSDPARRGQILEMRRNGKTARVQFVGFDRPTLHAVSGLVLISDSAQLPLFQ